MIIRLAGPSPCDEVALRAPRMRKLDDSTVEFRHVRRLCFRPTQVPHKGRVSTNEAGFNLPVCTLVGP